ncbi:RNA methyltransferase [Psychrobacter arenosus]|nr:TrmH family RNA methyltransferase [Psychrobacter arenosus]
MPTESPATDHHPLDSQSPIDSLENNSRSEPEQTQQTLAGSKDTSSQTVALANVADYLQCLQVVMVNTTLPANIGSAARAMHTMGLSRLTVVDPRLPIDDTSVAHAAGGTIVLDQAKITDTLSEALAPCQLVFAASSRSRHLPRPVVTPRQAADIMLRFIEQQTQSQHPSEASGTIKPPASIAILFGREDRGLTNEELALADYHIQIQANPEYPVLNVASAVQVIASFIFAQIQDHLDQAAANIASAQANEAQTAAQTKPATDTAHNATHELDVILRQVWDEPAITHEQAQQLTDRLTDLMVQLKLANPEHLRALPQRLSRLTSRLQLDQKEYQLLSAVLAKLTP